MSLLVVITSYRTPDLTIDCLHSLAEEKKNVPEMKVGICDNGNTDNTFERLTAEIEKNNWHEWVYIRRVMPNRGFSGGNNVILREALNADNCPDLFLLLNTDTIVRLGSLNKLIEGAEKNPEVGILTPKMEELDGTPLISYFRNISPLSELIHSANTGLVTRLFQSWVVPLDLSINSSHADWLCFASVIIKKEVMLQIGVLDEGYFLYFDDVDYCRVAVNAGWKIKYIPEAAVAHIGGQSNLIEENASQGIRRPNYWYNSRSWYFIKFYGKTGLFLANICWILGRFISKSREVLGNKKPHLCEKEGRDNWIGFFSKVIPRTSIEEIEK